MTWRLFDSLPNGLAPDLSIRDGVKFARSDRILDTAQTGPRWLGQPAVAQIVVETLELGIFNREYDLGAWVLMPNHVHLIIRPQVELSVVINQIKGRSARLANAFLGRKGLHFWAKEYYDHWIRDRVEEEKIARYIENNPVKAGLCGSPDGWPWSSTKRA